MRPRRPSRRPATSSYREVAEAREKEAAALQAQKLREARKLGATYAGTRIGEGRLKDLGQELAGARRPEYADDADREFWAGYIDVVEDYLRDLG